MQKVDGRAPGRQPPGESFPRRNSSAGSADMVLQGFHFFLPRMEPAAPSHATSGVPTAHRRLLAGFNRVI